MKRIEKLYAYSLLFIFAGVIVHAPLSVWLGTKFPAYTLLIKSWKEIIMLLLMPVAVWLVTKRRLWGVFSRDWLFRLLVGYALLYLVTIVIGWQGATQTMAGLGIDLRYMLYFALVYTLIRIAPGYKPLFIKVAVGGAVVVVGFATMQLFLPHDILAHIGYGKNTIEPYLLVDLNSDFVRVNSTLRGPNPLGAYAGSVLVLVGAYMVYQKKQLEKRAVFAVACFLATCGAIALWISYSRSALLAAAVGVAVVWLLPNIKKVSRIAWITGVAALLILAGLVFAARGTSFVQNTILHANPNGGSVAKSDEGHITSLTDGAHQVLAHPLGAGIGSTGSASLLGSNGVIIENQYLFIAHEAGWLALALYIGIFVLLLQRLVRARSDWLPLGVFASGIVLGLIGLLLPVWADDTVAIVWWGLAAVTLGGIDGKNRKSK